MSTILSVSKSAYIRNINLTKDLINKLKLNIKKKVMLLGI